MNVGRDVNDRKDKENESGKWDAKTIDSLMMAYSRAYSSAIIKERIDPWQLKYFPDDIINFFYKK